MYNIKVIESMLEGTSLVICIPNEELDKKALYTIEDTKPEFLLPFQNKFVDGNIEFIYQVKTLCKLQYMAGVYGVNEYIQLWISIITPLLTCRDWFMKMEAFILSLDFLYFDKEQKKVCYIYVPTIKSCSEVTDYRMMVEKLAEKITVSDVTLENKVLRSVINGSDLNSFLVMLKSYSQTPVIPVFTSPAAIKPIHGLHEQTLPKPKLIDMFPNTVQPEISKTNIKSGINSPVININDNDNRHRDINIFPANLNTGLNSAGSNQNEIKQKPSKRELKKMMKNKKCQDSGKTEITPVINRTQPETPEFNKTLSETPMYQEILPVSDLYDDATEIISINKPSCSLRLVGSPLLPKSIDVEIKDGGTFTIGRYDATAGIKMSDFEFDRKTKAISRRHAVIERHSDIYRLIDLSSNAGTYLNGQKLPPSTPVELIAGSRVSFGVSGADYIWEA